MDVVVAVDPAPGAVVTGREQHVAAFVVPQGLGAERSRAATSPTGCVGWFTSRFEQRSAG